jgi:hypothetical protein
MPLDGWGEGLALPALAQACWRSLRVVRCCAAVLLIRRCPSRCAVHCAFHCLAGIATSIMSRPIRVFPSVSSRWSPALPPVACHHPSHLSRHAESGRARLRSGTGIGPESGPP